MDNLIQEIGFLGTFHYLKPLEGEEVTCTYKIPAIHRRDKLTDTVKGKLKLKNHTITVGEKSLILYDEILLIDKQ